MSCHYPFCRNASLTVSAVAACWLLTPAIVPLRAQLRQTAQQAALSDGAKSDAAKPEAGKTRGRQSLAATTTGAAGGNVAAANRPIRRSKSAAAKEPHRQGDRQGEGGREIGRRHLQPRALPAAEGRRQVDGLAAACRSQARRRPAGRDRRVRLVVDRGLRRDVAGIQLSQSPRGATAPAISERRHHRRQSRPGRRRRARNDEAAADRSDRHASGSGDLAGRDQRRAAQPRSDRDRQDGRRRRRAHSGRRRRSGAGRSPIFAAGHRQGRRAPARW